MAPGQSTASSGADEKTVRRWEAGARAPRTFPALFCGVATDLSCGTPPFLPCPSPLVWFWQKGQPALASERPEPCGKTWELGCAGGGGVTARANVLRQKQMPCRRCPLSVWTQLCPTWTPVDMGTNCAMVIRPVQSPASGEDPGRAPALQTTKAVRTGGTIPSTPLLILPGSSLRCPLLPSPSLGLPPPPRLNSAASSCLHPVSILLGFLPCSPCPGDLSLTWT